MIRVANLGFFLKQQESEAEFVMIINSSTMASCLSLTGFCRLNVSIPRQKQRVIIKYPEVRSQSFRDEGKSADIVEENLSILRKRIEEVRKKKRLNLNEGCRLKNGWNYSHVYDSNHKHKRRVQIISEWIEILGLVSGAVGLVFLSGSLCIFLVSFLVNFSKIN